MTRTLTQTLTLNLIKGFNPNICSGCRKEIFGMSLKAMGCNFHPECFKCAGCQRQLPGSHYMRGDPPLPYHKECAEELFSLRCCVCSGIINGQYFSHPFFKEEVMCVNHQNCRSCFSCNRREPIAGKSNKEGFSELPDGRVSCMDCISTAIIDSSEALPLYLEAISFMEDILRLPIPKGMREVPVLAVDLMSLNDQLKNVSSEAHQGETRLFHIMLCPKLYDDGVGDDHDDDKVFLSRNYNIGVIQNYPHVMRPSLKDVRIKSEH
jgi:hypothetical protein